MNTNRKSKNIIVSILLFLVTLFACLCGMYTSRPAHADMGPKPSVTVTVENLDGRACYGTLLSNSKYSGPHHAYMSKTEQLDTDEDSIWKAFVEYSDPDGYYYLQEHWNFSLTGEISWRYYPPSKFKILLYFPDTKTFVSSGIYESYAFHSYFKATLTDSSVSVSQSEALEISKNYDYTWEIVSLFVRIIATVLIELGIALLFRLRTKKQLVSITVVNVITQTLLNLALNIYAYFRGVGYFDIMLLFAPLELAVFVIEAVIYAIVLRRGEPKTVLAYGAYGMPYSEKNPKYASIGKCILYSLAANVVSFIAGLALARIIPGIF